LARPAVPPALAKLLAATPHHSTHALLRRGRPLPSGARPSYTWYAGRLGTGRGARARVQVRTNSKKQQIQRRQLDAGPTTSPGKPTASMHMSAASYCRAGALTRFIDARHARTARTAGRRALLAHGRSGGQGGAPLWPLSAPVGLVVVHARCHHHARAHCTGLGRPHTLIGRDQAISKSARRPCMSTASWATCAARPTALTATRGTTPTLPKTVDRTCSGRPPCTHTGER
jgi:hypothetical protein